MAIYDCLHEHFKQVALQEAFVGKTDTLLEMENQIGLIRQNALKKFTDINKSPEVLAFNRLMEKQFGMDCYTLFIDQSNVLNAYTMVVAANFDIALHDNISDYVCGDRSIGYKWKEGNNLCIMACVYLGVLQDERFTNEEILAILLHELGHNFADAIYDDIKLANKEWAQCCSKLLIWTTIMTFFIMLPFSIAFYIKNTNKYKRKQGKKTKKNIFRGIRNGLKALISDRENFWNEVFARLKGGSAWENYKMYMDSMNAKEYYRSSLGRQNEVIADKFAGVYGYGPAQISALIKLGNKMSDAEKFVCKIPFIGALRNEQFNNQMLDINDYDVHPHDVQRAWEEIKLLERELKRTDVDPKLRKIMEDQIKEIKITIGKAAKASKEASTSEKAKADYYAYMNDQCPDAINQDLEDKIAEAMDSVLEKK